MIKSFFISFSLKNTYRVNTILYAIKQIPLIKKLLPDKLYSVSGLKIFANILSVIWEIAGMFLGKLLYLLFMVAGAASLYGNVDKAGIFVHILFFLSLVGALMNTYMFNPSNDKYYAMFLMRMEARSYTLSNFLYSLGKVIVGFMPFTILFGRSCGVPWWCCIFFPFFIAGVKVLICWNFLEHFRKTGVCRDENLPGKTMWVLIGLLLAAAYVPPYFEIRLPLWAVGILGGAAVLAACAGAVYMAKFGMYRELYQHLLVKQRSGMDTKAMMKAAATEQNRKIISQDTGITSSKEGFEFFNELFIRRHQKILWKSVKKQAAVCLMLIAAAVFFFQVNPNFRLQINKMLMGYLPYFVFIMYIINRGTSFTQALFMNCDHSMLTYSFYKRPDFILKLFRIRLREIVKVNLLPAVVIGGGLVVLLYCSGGTDNPMDYVILLVAVLFMSIFFSVHYLTCYYLLQPYNAGTEIVGGTYKIVSWVTYIVCYLFIKVRMEIFLFGIMTIVFCILYSVGACVMVYRMAGKTFRLRN